MKKIFIVAILFTGCMMSDKRFKVVHGSGVAYADSYSVDENGCLHLQYDNKDSCNCGPDIICEDFTITDLNHRNIKH